LVAFGLSAPDFRSRFGKRGDSSGQRRYILDFQGKAVNESGWLYSMRLVGSSKVVESFSCFMLIRQCIRRAIPTILRSLDAVKPKSAILPHHQKQSDHEI
jgi:hypothetical protein